MTQEQPVAPSLSWRLGSQVVMAAVGSACRAFLLAGNRLEVTGLDKFLELLREREDPRKRERGLLTVSNHLSIIDDPLMWGALPLKCHWDPDNSRWALGSHDLVFKNALQSYFFSLGQVFPTHRLAHSKYGGLFQPTMMHTIRLLSRAPFAQDAQGRALELGSEVPPDIQDPFSSSQLTYTTNGTDSFQVPSAYQSRRHAWVHVFPEGRIHQRPDRTMRYFKWGVSRLILESEPCPDLVPIWIEGFEQVYHQSRGVPRSIPRAGKSISITFGARVDVEAVFGDLRERWRALQERAGEKDHSMRELGVLSDELKYGEDAVRLREECTFRVREEVLKLRRARGWPDEDPKARLVDTWREEGAASGRSEGQMQDGSWVKDH